MLCWLTPDPPPSWIPSATPVSFNFWQTIFLPVPGLVETELLKPADLVGVNKDSYLILEALPSEFDSRVKAMEVDEKPTEEFSDVGGLDAQIQELVGYFREGLRRGGLGKDMPVSHWYLHCVDWPHCGR